jgi:hypothetical protein
MARVPSSNGSALHSASGVWSTCETVRLSSDAGTPPLLSLLLSPSLLRVLRSRGLAPLLLPLMRGRCVFRVLSSNGSALHSASGVPSTREAVRLS